MLAPFVLWLGLYLVSMRHFVPRLGRVAQEQSDARAPMTGRITDAYTYIATVKRFSHSRREAGFAQRDAGVPRHRAPPDAAGHRLRDRQPGVERDPDRLHRRHRARAVDRRRSRRRRSRAATATPRRIATPVVAHREPMAPTTCVVGGAS
jgi:ABC-type multidrug transport system fused ATPase/permease subunit